MPTFMGSSSSYSAGEGTLAVLSQELSLCQSRSSSVHPLLHSTSSHPPNVSQLQLHGTAQNSSFGTGTSRQKIAPSLPNQFVMPPGLLLSTSAAKSLSTNGGVSLPSPAFSSCSSSSSCSSCSSSFSFLPSPSIPSQGRLLPATRSTAWSKCAGCSPPIPSIPSHNQAVSPSEEQLNRKRVLDFIFLTASEGAQRQCSSADRYSPFLTELRTDCLHFDPSPDCDRSLCESSHSIEMLESEIVVGLGLDIEDSVPGLEDFDDDILLSDEDCSDASSPPRVASTWRQISCEQDTLPTQLELGAHLHVYQNRSDRPRTSINISPSHLPVLGTSVSSCRQELRLHHKIEEEIIQGTALVNERKSEVFGSLSQIQIQKLSPFASVARSRKRVSFASFENWTFHDHGEWVKRLEQIRRFRRTGLTDTGHNSDSSSSCSSLCDNNDGLPRTSTFASSAVPSTPLLSTSNRSFGTAFPYSEWGSSDAARERSSDSRAHLVEFWASLWACIRPSWTESNLNNKEGSQPSPVTGGLFSSFKAQR
ncbi:hypothetical protein DFJ73DRAFT_761662 [Zopfochytrium polystomum]|nr:hypothetical protein DFJ73DRAFT_761662 [Zopfochytrium polystomum]